VQEYHLLTLLFLKFASHYHPNVNYHSSISSTAGELEEWKGKKVREKQRNMERNKMKNEDKGIEAKLENSVM
jgi:hypothetical protein